MLIFFLHLSIPRKIHSVKAGNRKLSSLAVTLVEMPHRTSDLPLISWLPLYQRLSHPDPLFTEAFWRKSLPGVCEQSPRNSTELTYAKNSKLTVLICAEISYPSIIRLTPSGRSLIQNQRKIFCLYIDILPNFSSSPTLSQLKTGCYY